MANLARSLIAALTVLFVAGSCHAAVKVCHVSDNRILGQNEKVGNNPRINGIILAYEEFKKRHSRNASKVELVNIDDIDNVPLLQKLEISKRESCDLLIGIDTSRQALIVGPWLARNRIMGVSTTATVNKIDNYYPYLISMMIASKDFMRKMAGFIRTNAAKKIIIIKYVDDIYSKVLTAQLMREIQNKATVIQVNEGHLLSKDDLKMIRSTPNAMIVFTGFYFASQNILYQLSELNGDLVRNNVSILGSPEWIFEERLVKRLGRLKDLPKMYLISAWDMTSKAQCNVDFIKKYKEKYGSVPMSKEAFSYDAGKMIFDCIGMADGDIASTYACLSRKRTFTGATGDSIYNEKSSQPVKEVNILRADVQGFTQVKN